MDSQPQSTSQYSPAYLEERRKSYNIISVAVTFIVIVTTSTVIRWCSRRLQANGVCFGDVFIGLSWLFNIALSSVCLLSLRYGAARHIQALQPWQVKPYFVIGYYAAPVVYLPAVTFPKLAVLNIYLHVFVNKASRIISWLVGAVLVANIIVNTIVTADQCHPAYQLWHPVPGGWCNDVRAHNMWTGLPNIVTDAVMLLLPLHMVWFLHTSRNEKFGIFLTFLVGNLGLATSIFRFITFLQPYADPSWLAPEVYSVVIIEGGVYHFCACLITLRPLLSYVAKDSFLAPYVRKCFPCCTRPSRGYPSADSETTQRVQDRWLGHFRRSNMVPTITSASESYILQPNNDARSVTRKESHGGIHIRHDFEICEDHFDQGSSRAA